MVDGRSCQAGPGTLAAGRYSRNKLFGTCCIEGEHRITRPDAANGLDVAKGQALEWLANARPLVSHLVPRPFLDAYRVVGEQLAALDEDEEVVQSTLVDSCLRIGYQWTLQHILASEESVSGEMCNTALRLAGHRDLLNSKAPYLGKRRREFADELGEVARAIGRIAERDDATAAMNVPSPLSPRRRR